MNPSYKSPIRIIKRFVQLNGKALALPVEQFVEVLSPSSLDLIISHHKSTGLILDAFDLLYVPRIPFTDLGHLVDVLFSSLYAQPLIKVLISPIPCFADSSLGGLLCHFAHI